MKNEACYENQRVKNNAGSAVDGTVVWSIDKLFWMGSIFTMTLIGCALTLSLENFLVFIITTAITLCLGHSLGMHRLLIHRSYQAPKWLEYFLVHCGVIVGLAGPKGMIRTHDLRDWAQRQPQCHDYFSHQQPMRKDFIWQLFCDFKFDSAPTVEFEAEVEHDKVYYWMEKYWKWQQLPLAAVLFFLGGIEWVVWGIFARVSISVLGHWLIGYFAHNSGEKHWHVSGAAAQGFNIKFASLITMGESYHNNHHAFPGSAKLGINQGELDPGWWVLKVLEWLGLVGNIKLPDDLPPRNELIEINNPLHAFNQSEAES
ncbi:acyl-CoA desaturase [Aliikangiella marina]|uniref:Acyl-CoA desaturase n=1 Tax=Aliikangiella marina TaxID=1712262 RepID=A0A545T4H6_9GAMM|nr:acyl-CoA desaturase [Aliikangiella marina]TQV72119.1 acyl-CoA desaturase [Aliikangiella marina]